MRLEEAEDSSQRGGRVEGKHGAITILTRIPRSRHLLGLAQGSFHQGVRGHVARGARRGGQDGPGLWEQVELEGDVRAYTEDWKGAEVFDIDFERGSIVGNVATVETDEIAGLVNRRGRILAVFPWKGDRTTRLISEVLVGALSSEDVVPDLERKSAKFGNGSIGGGVVRGGGGEEVG